MADTAEPTGPPETVANPEAPKTTAHAEAPKTKKRKAPCERGPARPHRRLDLEVINLRVAMLQNRLERARSQAEDATRHVEGYLRELEFRKQE